VRQGGSSWERLGVIVAIVSLAATVVGIEIAHNDAGGSAGEPIPLTPPSSLSSTPPIITTGPVGPTISGTPSTSSSPTVSEQKPNGTAIGYYPVTLPNGHRVPIGPSRPKASDVSSEIGDLAYSSVSGEAILFPGGLNKIAPITGKPTYESCLSDTDLQDQVGASTGSAFCLYEDGMIAGGVVTYINPRSINPDSVMVQITVWSNH